MALSVTSFVLLLCFLALPALFAENVPFSRSNFPAGFIFGTSSAAYQYEGAAREGGKGTSVWDTFTHQHPEKIADHSTGDVSIDFYHRYKEDIGYLKEMGMDAFRFSISWTRILRNGTLSGGINKEGISFYNNLINDLVANALQPFVTLFHWDSPQALEDEYLGFLSPRIIDDFRNYAEICYKEFGDRVKHWITFNQPWSYSRSGYSLGTAAPGRCSPWAEGHCSQGDSAREPYIVAHHQLLAHAAAVKLYKEKYQASQKGKIGITLVSHWFKPYFTSKSDDDAVQRALDFMLGWFMDPLTQGDYPFIMRALVGDRLPKFTSKQSEMVKGSFDFIGLNYYTTYYAESISLLTSANASFTSDQRNLQTGVRMGILIGTQAASTWLYVYPPGFRDLLLYIKNKYNNPLIYVTENGVDEFNNASVTLNQARNDRMRIDFYKEHIFFLQKAISEGANVKGYFAWSLLDNFEWASGYTVRFGIVYVDYKNGLKRYPKNSYYWFQKFLKK